MGIFDLFSGESGRNAAIWGADQTQQGRDAALGTLTGGSQQALKSLGTGATQSLASLKAGEALSRKDIGRGTTNALSALQGGFQGAMPHMEAAQRYWNPLAQTANQGYNRYADASGAAGPEGNARATQNFQAGPGYQFQVDQATKQAVRAAAAAGMAASGNTMQAVNDRARNMANTEYQQYVQNLAPYLQLAPEIAGQQAGIEKDIAGMNTAYGQNRASLYSDQGKTLASLGSGMAANRAGIQTGLGASRAAVNTGLGQNQAAVLTNASNRTGDIGMGGLMAGQQGNANAMNTGLALANIGANVAGKVKNPFA